MSEENKISKELQERFESEGFSKPEQSRTIEECLESLKEDGVEVRESDVKKAEEQTTPVGPNQYFM